MNNKQRLRKLIKNDTNCICASDPFLLKNSKRRKPEFRFHHYKINCWIQHIGVQTKAGLITGLSVNWFIDFVKTTFLTHWFPKERFDCLLNVNIQNVFTITQSNCLNLGLVFYEINTDDSAHRAGNNAQITGIVSNIYVSISQFHSLFLMKKSRETLHFAILVFEE